MLVLREEEEEKGVYPKRGGRRRGKSMLILWRKEEGGRGGSGREVCLSYGRRKRRKQNFKFFPFKEKPKILRPWRERENGQKKLSLIFCPVIHPLHPAGFSTLSISFLIISFCFQNLDYQVGR